MALPEYKITFKDGSTQTVNAAQQGTRDGWLIFIDGTGEVLRVPSDDVESVARGGVPERVRPSGVESGAIA